MVASRRLRRPDLANDVVQLVFIQLTRDANRLPADYVLPACLHTVARRRTLDHLRAEIRLRRREQSAADDHSRNITPPTQNIDSDISSRLDAALAQLSVGDRETLVLRYFSGVDIGTVATRLGVSTEAAQKRVKRALQRLRSVLRIATPHGARTLGTWLSIYATTQAPSCLAATLCATAFPAPRHLPLSEHSMPRFL